jgi:hypothetical protein
MDLVLQIPMLNTHPEHEREMVTDAKHIRHHRFYICFEGNRCFVVGQLLVSPLCRTRTSRLRLAR